MESEVPQVSAAAVPAELGESVVLLDVREHDEWQRGHAPGAQHIPMAEVPARMAEINSGARLCVVCTVGGRSQRVAQFLQRHGFDPVNVDGGMSPLPFGRAVPPRVGGCRSPGRNRRWRRRDDLILVSLVR